MKKTTVLWVSNLLYRIKDNTRMFFLITITSTVALSSIGSVYSYWRDKETQVNKISPQSFFCVDTYNNKSKVDYKVNFIENSLKKEEISYTKVNGEMKFIIPNGVKDEVTIIKEDTYNKLAGALSLNTIDLKENETMLVSYLDKNKRKDIILDETKLQIVRESDSGVIPALYDSAYVVKDDVYEKMKGPRCYFGAFNVNNYKDTLSIGNNFYNKFGNDKGDKHYNNFLKAYKLEKTKIAYGVLLFSAIFIGLIFFVTTASFLYNKCYMDLIEDKKKYKQLNKIGLTYKEIKKVLNIEIGVLFLLPYIIAVVHFFFAISSLKCAFEIEITVPALQIIGIMLIVQIIYFLIIRRKYLFEIRKSLL
ncbi:FtsX-like permease family protein [Clostridium estertheticum]|uniref:FtsX-like permease family protein n=1 Tax=Clostridium estertheticum TaxID=238834 RepID=UPI001C0AA8BA|nr:FtsX-like permease family protein [Clostridium estertheticum]MBU3173448.1 hypothetical protein [Clostridium estertheticum]